MKNLSLLPLPFLRLHHRALCYGLILLLAPPVSATNIEAQGLSKRCPHALHQVFSPKKFKFALTNKRILVKNLESQTGRMLPHGIKRIIFDYLATLIFRTTYIDKKDLDGAKLFYQVVSTPDGNYIGNLNLNLPAFMPHQQLSCRGRNPEHYHYLNYNGRGQFKLQEDRPCSACLHHMKHFNERQIVMELVNYMEENALDGMLPSGAFEGRIEQLVKIR